MPRIEKLLIANRGEIASRIQRTAHAMGIATVAVYSDADADAEFVEIADEAVRIGPPPSVDSYLRQDRIIAAAKLTGADAVHPGFGFLAENADFARAVAEAGLIFVGPSPEAIAAMGSKQEAKRAVSKAGVPVIPGYSGDDQSTERLAKEARDMGFPVLLKASAGGGGKGMRIARSDEGLEAAIESAKREARNAFGDDTLLIEKYIDNPRHVEIQILGDTHGKLLHLFERECSIQRRHQKIVEESPSPALDAKLRAEMGEAALKVGRVVSYHNAGTVEFILAPDNSFYFLEVNTRLQVEHPVTEAITGVDLVREQLRVAQGEALTLTQESLELSGAAVEVRLYAEDPSSGFLPTSGPVVDFHLPPMDIRVDAGLRSGDTVSIYYDPMLAKIIAHAPTRAEATQKMIYALERLSVQGLTTNREFLLQVLRHPEYQQGNTDTHFIQKHLAAPAAEDTTGANDLAVSAALACVSRHQLSRQKRGVLPGLEPGYQNNRFRKEWIDFQVGDAEWRVSYLNLGHGRFEVSVGAHPQGEQELRPGEPAPEATQLQLELASPEPGDIAFTWMSLAEAAQEAKEQGLSRRQRARLVWQGSTCFVQYQGRAFALKELPRFRDRSQETEKGALTAPMPGKVVQVNVEDGAEVEAGATLVVLEAMKMEHAVKAPEAGTVQRVEVAVGDQVEESQVLVVLEDSDS